MLLELFIRPYFYQFFFMLRKTRTHLHGASNRPHTQLSRTHHPLSASRLPISPQQQDFSSSTSNPFASFVSKRKHSKRHITTTEADPSAQTEYNIANSKDSVENKLRKKYKNTKNIVKLIDHWGFTTKGYLTREQFRQGTEKVIGRQASDKELDRIMVRHSESTDHMDVKGLLSLLYGGSDGVPFDTLKMPVTENNPYRQQLIDNLKEDIKKYKYTSKSQLTEDSINRLVAKINTSISKMKQAQDGEIPKDKCQFFRQINNFSNFNAFEKNMLEQIEQRTKFQQVHKLLEAHKNADSLIIDPLLRNTRPLNPSSKIEPTQDKSIETFACKMKSLPNLFQSSLKSRQKRAPFDPVSLLNIDQRKTRFEGSAFTAQSGGWHPQVDCQGVQRDQKEKIVQALRDQAAVQRTRYENKLKKMKLNRELQRQNVELREQLVSQKEKSRLQRYRDQQQAYNYINFTKKRWE